MENGIGSYYRFLEGDKKAFEEIVALYSDSLLRFSYGFVRDYQLAEDVMMDVFAALIVKKRHFKEEAAFKTYLFRMARNKSIDVLRSRRRQLSLNEETEVGAVEASDVFVLRNERDERVFAALQSLTRQYRTVLYLAYFEDLSVEQICKVLKKNKKQVYNLLSRAKTSLRSKLSKEELNL